MVTVRRGRPATGVATACTLVACAALTACKNPDALPLRAMKLTMVTTTQGAADTSVEVTSPGKIATSDPTLSCTLEQESGNWTRRINCSRGDASIYASFHCPFTGTKIPAPGGDLTIGNTHTHVVHQFRADCHFGDK